jgi:hypothetical protein
VPNLHDARGVREWQRAEQNGVDDGEDGRVGADGESENQDGGARKPRITQQVTEAMAKVSENVVHGSPHFNDRENLVATV